MATDSAAATKPVAALAQSLLAAGIWIGLFELNAWAFTEFRWTQTISWIFIPASARLLAVLLWGWRGALGIGLGTLVTNVGVFALWSGQSLSVATLSAVAPLLAVTVARQALALPRSLHGLTAAALLLLGLLSAALSAALHSAYFWTIGMTSGFSISMMPMFVGDVAGTLIVLYLLRGLLTVADKVQRS